MASLLLNMKEPASMISAAGKFLIALSLVLPIHADAGKQLEEEAKFLYEKIENATASKYLSSTETLTLSGLKNTALSYGAQAGNYITTKALLEHLEKRFASAPFVDFRPIMLYQDGFMLLPAKVVIQKGREVITDTAARRVASIPKIIRQPRFVSVLPTWRDYFRIEAKPPVISRQSILPKTAQEKEIWKTAVAEGRQRGVEQVYEVFRRRIARMNDDYNGYVTYHLARHAEMISKPQFSSDFYAISGGGTSMNIDEVIVEVTVNPSLIGNRDAWETIPLLPSIFVDGSDGW
jgi:defect-in-organelle-trafficking protein DotC